MIGHFFDVVKTEQSVGDWLKKASLVSVLIIASYHAYQMLIA